MLITLFKNSVYWLLANCAQSRVVTLPLDFGISYEVDEMDMMWVTDLFTGRWAAWAILLTYLFTQVVAIGIYAVADILDHTLLSARHAAPPISPGQSQRMLVDLRRRLFRQFLIGSAMLAGGGILGAAVLYLLYVGSVLHIPLWRYLLLTVLVVACSPFVLFGPGTVAKYGLERIWIRRRVSL